MLLAVDTALRASGVALFDSHGTLLCADTVVNDVGRGAEAWVNVAASIRAYVQARTTTIVQRVIVEEMQVYSRSKSKADPDDLLQNQGVAGALCGWYAAMGAAVLSVKPAAWKGQVPKDVVTARVRRRLTAPELEVVFDKSATQHNALDAVGIGLWAVGRWT